MSWKLLLLMGVVSVPVVAQDTVVPQPPRVRNVPPAPAVVGGTVTGHVYAADNQRPARFADVELVQEMDSGRGGGRGFNRGPNYNTQARGRTALDGSFTIQNVAPGDYYVVASMTGYISPLQVSRMNQTSLNAPQTHVSSNGSADVVVSMERGSVVTGRVTYDDGSPVAGVPVRVALVSAAGSNGGMTVFGSPMAYQGFIFGGGSMAQTDDRGVFRVMGVPAGKYVVSTTMQTESIGEGRAGRQTFRGPPPMLTVYAPATMHKAEGQTIEVRGGETVDGVDIRVALNGLHTVKGSVEAKADSHLLGSGTVSLADAGNNSTVRMAMVDQDGSFRMDYVPAGTYTLSVSGEDRPQPDANGDRRGSSKRYERATVSVTVGDHDAVLDPVQLTEATSSQAGSR